MMDGEEASWAEVEVVSDFYLRHRMDRYCRITRWRSPKLSLARLWEATRANG